MSHFKKCDAMVSPFQNHIDFFNGFLELVTKDVKNTIKKIHYQPVGTNRFAYTDIIDLSLLYTET
jgi:hypothetical protein